MNSILNIISITIRFCVVILPFGFSFFWHSDIGREWGVLAHFALMLVATFILGYILFPPRVWVVQDMYHYPTSNAKKVDSVTHHAFDPGSASFGTDHASIED